MESFYWANIKTKQEIFTIRPKRTINWEKYIHFWKLFYIKVSHKRWLTVNSYGLRDPYKSYGLRNPYESYELRNSYKSYGLRNPYELICINYTDHVIHMSYTDM